MSSPSSLRPPPATSPSDNGAGAEAAPADGAATSPRRRERRGLRVGIGVSILVHLVLVILYPGLMERVPEGQISPTPSSEVLPVQGIEIVTFRELEDEPEADEAETPPEIVLDLPDPVPSDAPEALPLPPPTTLPTPGEGAPAAQADPDRRTAAERLRPQMGDPRLWAPLDRAYLDLSEEERAELYLRGMIRSWNDSVAVAVALSGEATDWTYTDDEGRRWGLSPGRLHLGDFSIPLPLSFELPPGRRDIEARRNWEIQDILRGVASAEVRASWAQRAQEIRDRMEAERAAAQGGGGGGTGGGSGSSSGGGSGGGSGSGGGN